MPDPARVRARPGVARSSRLIERFASETRPDRKSRDLSGITDREREVLRLVGLGLSNAEIATALLVITAYQANLFDT